MSSTNTSFLNEYLPYLLRRFDQSLSAQFYSLLNSYEITRSQWRVLAVLQESGELSILDLATAALTPQPTVTHAVARLCERELVDRAVGIGDKRQRFVSISQKGSDLAISLTAQARVLEAGALAEAGDLGNFVEQLRELTKVVEAKSQVNLLNTNAG